MQAVKQPTFNHQEALILPFSDGLCLIMSVALLIFLQALRLRALLCIYIYIYIYIYINIYYIKLT